MNRRANGAGGKPWFNPARQQFEIKVSLPDGTRRTVRGNTEREAERERESLLGNIESGKPLTTQTLTVSHFLETMWLPSLRLNPTLKAGTYRSYETHTRLYLVPTLGKLSLKLLSRGQVKTQLVDAMLASGKSPRLVQMMQAVLRIALAYAMDLELVDRNVASRLKIKVPDNSRYGKALSVEQLMALLSAASGMRSEPLFAFLVATGVRLGEALALRWSDIDLPQNRFNVMHTLQPPTLGEPWALVLPKTGRPRLNIPLVGDAIAALERQQSKQAFERKVAREAWREDLDFVFTNEIGEPTAQRGVQDAWDLALQRAGIDSSYRIHDLRHTAVTYLYKTGVPLPVVMEIVGHTTLAMTQRYAHADDDMIEEARLKLDAFWKASRGQ